MGKECAICEKELTLRDPKHNIKKGVLCNQCFTYLGYSTFKDALTISKLSLQEIVEIYEFKEETKEILEKIKTEIEE